MTRTPISNCDRVGSTKQLAVGEMGTEGRQRCNEVIGF